MATQRNPMYYSILGVLGVGLCLALGFGQELLTMQEWMYVIVLMLVVGFLLNVQRRS